MIYNENAKWGRNRDRRKELVNYMINTFGFLVSRKQVLSLVSGGKCEYNELTWLFVNKEFKSVRGQYDLSSMIVTDVTENSTIHSPELSMSV